MTQYRIEGDRAEAISGSVERGIRVGGLPPGVALPPVRRLAADLGVAPATVAAAYADLRRRGLVETAGRRGTRVRHRPTTALRALGPVPVPSGALDLAHGEPDLGLLPPLGPVLARLDLPPSGYADDALLPALREAGTARLAADGVPVESLTVCHGALDAIERCLRTRARPGDRVAVEDPAWANLLDLLAAMDLEPVGMEVDDEGPRPDAVAAALRRGVAAVLVTSRAQNPTGAAVGVERAAALRALLDGSDVLVIEDDHAAELARVPFVPVAGAGPSWAVIRSVSKPYGPDLRCALLAGDERTIARVDGHRRLGPGWVSRLTQRIVVGLWQDPAVDALVAHAASTYDARRGALAGALADVGVPTMARTGLNVWVPVADETAAVTTLRDAGIVVVPGARYRLGSGPAIRVTTSRLPTTDAPTVATVIAAAAHTRAESPR